MCDGSPGHGQRGTGLPRVRDGQPLPTIAVRRCCRGSQSPAPVLHREGLSVGPLPTDDGQLVEPSGDHRPTERGFVASLCLHSCVRPASSILFVSERVLALPGYTAQPGASFMVHVLSDGKTYTLSSENICMSTHCYV